MPNEEVPQSAALDESYPPDPLEQDDAHDEGHEFLQSQAAATFGDEEEYGPYDEIGVDDSDRQEVDDITLEDGVLNAPADVVEVPPAAPMEEKPKFRAQVQGDVEYSAAEEAELGEMLTSLDPAKALQATRYIQRREMEAMEARILQRQIASSDDPYEPMVQQKMAMLAKTNPNAYNDPVAKQTARLLAAGEIGQAEGDIYGAMRRLIPELAGTPPPVAQPPAPQQRRPAPIAPPQARMPAPSVGAGAERNGRQNYSNSIARQISQQYGEDLTPGEEAEVARQMARAGRGRR